jgi:pilin/secretion family protein with methylation motif
LTTLQEARHNGREAGFTLMEALMAIVILVFGLIAVTNLMIVGATSNLTASQVSASASLCSQQMDTLKAIPFDTLTGPCGATCGGLATDVAGYFSTQVVDGVGRFKVRWQITPVAGQAQLYFIQARCQVAGGLMASRTVTDLTSFRACTDASLNCPVAP